MGCNSFVFDLTSVYEERFSCFVIKYYLYLSKILC